MHASPEHRALHEVSLQAAPPRRKSCAITAGPSLRVRTALAHHGCSDAEQACRLSVTLQVHSEERRGLDRLEIRRSGALSSKSLSDEKHAQRVQVCSAAQSPPCPLTGLQDLLCIMTAERAPQLWLQVLRRSGC